MQMIYTMNNHSGTSQSSERVYRSSKDSRIIDVVVERRESTVDRRSVSISQIHEKSTLDLMKTFDTRSSAGRRKSDINTFKGFSVKA